MSCWNLRGWRDDTNMEDMLRARKTKKLLGIDSGEGRYSSRWHSNSSSFLGRHDKPTKPFDFKNLTQQKYTVFFFCLAGILISEKVCQIDDAWPRLSCFEPNFATTSRTGVCSNPRRWPAGEKAGDCTGIAGSVHQVILTWPMAKL